MLTVIPNQKLVADYAHIRSLEGWLYIAAVIDLFSHRFVGSSMKAEMTASPIADAQIMVIWGREKPDKILCHSDRGSQYQSEFFRG